MFLNWRLRNLYYDMIWYSDKLWSWKWFLWLRHNTANWRSNQCCWQPDRKCINYLSALELKMLARYSRIREVLVKFITTLPSSAVAPVDRLFSTAGHWLKCHAATIWVTQCLRNFCYWKQITVCFRTEVFYWHYYLCFYLMALILQSTFDATVCEVVCIINIIQYNAMSYSR